MTLTAQSFPEPPDYRLEDVYKALKRMAGSFDAIEEKAFRGTKRTRAKAENPPEH